MTISRWVTDVLTWLLPPCREVVRWTSQELDGQLRWHQRARMQVHLLICALCKRYRQQLIALRAALRSDPERLADVGDANQLTPAAKQHIKEVLQKSTTRRTASADANDNPPVPKM